MAVLIIEFLFYICSQLQFIFIRDLEKEIVTLYILTLHDHFGPPHRVRDSTPRDMKLTFLIEGYLAFFLRCRQFLFNARKSEEEEL